jgi:hypothetical protein
MPVPKDSVREQVVILAACDACDVVGAAAEGGMGIVWAKGLLYDRLKPGQWGPELEMGWGCGRKKGSDKS